MIKQSRLDAIHGLVDLMDAALEAGGRVATPTLILVGTKDELIPRRPTLDLLARLPADAARRCAPRSTPTATTCCCATSTRRVCLTTSWPGSTTRPPRYRAGADR